MSIFLALVGTAFALIISFIIIRLLMEAANFIGNKLEFARLSKEAADFIRERIIKFVK